MKKISFEKLKNMMLYHSIQTWNDNVIILDNGLKISIEMTDSDCCARAWGAFSDVELEAAITDVTEREYTPWRDEDTYGCSALVKFLHNQNIICKANADADAGNGGYYFSIASFILSWNGEEFVCHFVGSDDG